LRTKRVKTKEEEEEEEMCTLFFNEKYVDGRNYRNPLKILAPINFFIKEWLLLRKETRNFTIRCAVVLPSEELAELGCEAIRFLVSHFSFSVS
jgi:hypothetical protein